ncbi:Hypothetical predicted protein [Cloeon dipterum]|uniref:IGFBP N-terminal domain-containing protein n=1 Tax=Cloeon dipterum TaxID=197152 RepID=A0A8S1CHU6_9INSE|nr:Hypothetical predicted protein [Cloeon dipterum]
MEAVRLEIELNLLQIKEARTVDSLRAVLEEILSLEHQENKRILSVDLSPSLKEKVEALHSACLNCIGMQRELLEEEKSLSEFQISQLQGAKDHCFEDKNATKARLVSLKNQLQIATHFNKSLENTWKDAVRSLSSVKCGIINLDASACACEKLTRSYLNQRLKEKAADMARLQKNRSHLEQQKRHLSIDTNVETEIKSPTLRALQEIAKNTTEKQQLKLQCRNLAERKQAKLERLERARDELQKLKHNKGTKPSEEALEKFDKEIIALEARNLSLQQLVDKNGGYIQKMKDEIIQLEFQISSENEAMQKAESARESELQFLLDEIAAAEKEQILLKDQNAALKAKIEKISLDENRTDAKKLADKKAMLNDELKEMQARVEKKDGSNQTRAANIKELQQKIAELEREINESTALREKVMTKYRSEMENLQAEIAALESDLKSLSEVSITTEKSMEESKENLTLLEAVLAGKKKTQAKLQQQLDAVKKENELAVDTLKLFEESKQAEEQAKKEQAARDAKLQKKRCNRESSLVATVLRGLRACKSPQALAGVAAWRRRREEAKELAGCGEERARHEETSRTQRFSQRCPNKSPGDLFSWPRDSCKAYLRDRELNSPGECEPLTEADCPRGSALVWDPCGCCRVCARLENEPCGGPDGFFGTCARGLQCVAVNVKLDGVCKRPPERKSGCGSRARERTGCNIVEGKCACGSSTICPGDLPPFTFENLAECEINLKSSSGRQAANAPANYSNGQYSNYFKPRRVMNGHDFRQSCKLQNAFLFAFARCSRNRSF